ncbi:hypothetical protein OG21DRAFT_126879 [Imleria badia]|nr:hypothetical protein OG21DRAFT_126879 [Imleria badia]
MTKDGHFVVYVLLSEERLDIPRWRLLEFCFNGQSAKPCAVSTFDVPASEFKSNVAELDGGNSPFLYIPECKLVFETRTRIFYEFPKFRIALDETWYKAKTNFGFSPRPDCIVLTSTHVITLHRYPHSFTVPVMLIRAFTVPPPWIVYQAWQRCLSPL